MARRILLVALALCLGQPAVVQAQLTLEEFKVFNQLLTEPDTKPSFDKRLRLIGDALEREADPKKRPGNVQVDLKRARIPAADGVPFLVKRLDHSSELVKRSALRMLAAYGVEGKSALPDVLERLKQDPVPTVHAEAMLTLGKIGPTDAASAAAILERLGADDANDATNRAALQALVAMASVVPKSAEPRVAKFLEHRFTDMGITAHELIGKILALPRPTLAQIQAMKTIDWRNSPDQGYAVFTTIAEAGNRAAFTVPLLLNVLDATPPPYLECIAVETLARVRTGNPQAITAFLERTIAKDLTVRAKARIALQQIDLKQAESVRALAAGLRRKERGVRFDAAVMLRSWDETGRMPSAAHGEMLAPLLEALGEVDDTLPSAHLEMYLALMRRFGSRGAPAADALLKQYQSEAYFTRLGGYGVVLRGKVLAALANVGMPESGRKLILDILQKGPTDPTDGGFAYAAAARAVGTSFEAKQVVPLLLPGLKLKDPDRALLFIDWSGEGQPKPTTLRVEAMRALAKIGPPANEALSILQEIGEEKVVASTNLGLLAHQEARKAFQAIAGKPLPPAKGLFADGKREMLNLDERLDVKMTLKLLNARPKDVLKRLQQATNLNFTMDENVDPDTPVWGSMQAMQMPAWITMRQMASAPSVQGTWEDVGDGYRLVGKKRTGDEKFPKPKTPFPPFKDESEPPQKLTAADGPAKKEYSEDYHPALKDKRKELPGLIIYGPEANECVRFEPEGLRISLPLDYPRPRPGTGVITDFGVKGDFEITVGFELLPDPVAGQPIMPGDLKIVIVPNEPIKPEMWHKSTQNRAALARSAANQSQAGQFIANATIWTEDVPKDKWGNENFSKVEQHNTHSFPAAAKTGQLRLVRSDATLYYFSSDGEAKDFALLHKHEFGAKELKSVRILGSTSGAGASFDFRITDVRIRADAFVKSAATVAIPVSEEVPARRWWIIPLAIALPILAIVMGLGIWLLVRMRRPTAPAEPIAATPVSDAITFACRSCGKRLKAKAASAGKKLKCPGCGKPAAVPKSADDDA